MVGWKLSRKGVGPASGRPVWPQPREDEMRWALEGTRGWVTEGLVNHVENFGYHLQDDGRPLTGLGLGVVRPGSWFDRVFLLVGCRMDQRGDRETDLQSA